MDDTPRARGCIVAVATAVTFMILITGVADAENEALQLDPPANVTREPRSEIRLILRARGGVAPVKYALGTIKKNGAAVTAVSGLLLNAETGALSWMPTESQAGAYDVELSAKDGDGRSSATTFHVTILERPITGDHGPIGKLLKQWQAEGTAAGNTGDFYDNRDRDHSPLHRGPWPQLDQVVYTPDQLSKRLDWAAQHTLLPHVTFGNSSTSAPVTLGGSNIRMYYVHPRGALFLYEEYRGNNLYMYPGHHDHHPGRNGRPFYGDVFPANTPYLIGSQGSSGTDQPFMRAVPFTLAAFRPEVKKKLTETGLLMPTVQMIFRSSNKHLKAPEEYLTGKAHPTIFEGSWVDDLKMVNRAHEITLETLPPMVQMKVVEEDEAVDGKDYFEAGKSEKLFDTPAAIARIVRSPRYVRRMVVSAEGSFDVNKKPLSYRWVVLRGDAKRIQIKPKNEAGSVVELLVPYHERSVIPDSAQKIESNRVDIGLFVNNGTSYSAPGFVTFFSLDSEARTYDADGKLIEIGYGAGEANLNVSNWKELFDALEGNGATWPEQLLRKAFKDEERAALTKVAAEYRSAAAKLDDEKEKAKKGNDAKQRATASSKAADDALKLAQKAHAEAPTPETKSKLATAEERKTLAEAVRKQLDAAAAEMQKKVDAASREADAVLTQKKPGLDRPVKELMETTFLGLRDDLQFYLKNRAVFEEHISKTIRMNDAKKREFEAARKRWDAWGLMKPDSDAIHSIRGGEAPVTERLTQYEKTLLRRLHAEMLAQFLYPKFLNVSFTPNFVDQRITGRKEWRDIYRHDDAGKVIGWTRVDASGKKDYTAEGRLILEKDDKGRPTKARSVVYNVDWIDRRFAIHALKPTPGDTLFTYEYGPAGKATVKEGKVEEKK